MLCSMWSRIFILWVCVRWGDEFRAFWRSTLAFAASLPIEHRDKSFLASGVCCRRHRRHHQQYTYIFYVPESRWIYARKTQTKNLRVRIIFAILRVCHVPTLCECNCISLQGLGCVGGETVYLCESFFYCFCRRRRRHRWCWRCCRGRGHRHHQHLSKRILCAPQHGIW